MVRSPSIAIGLCQALAHSGGIDASAHSFHVEFQEYLLGLPAKRGRLMPDEYEAICGVLQNVGAGEWPFLPRSTPAQDDAFFDLMRRHSDVARRLLPKLQRLAEAVPDFLERCADEVLANKPDVVGFTTVYAQTWPNAALARILKHRQPSLPIVFGGASCEGPMGSALLEALPWVDVVVRGEAEQLVVPLVRRLADGEPLEDLANLVYRTSDGQVAESLGTLEPVEMDAVPIPDYFEYFERLERCPQVAASLEVQVPIELSRGCWWGAKHHCTFCGLNGLSMASRAKSPESAYATAAELSRRHKRHDFTATDNILPREDFKTLLPRLAADESDLTLFYEVKANMTFDEVALLRRAGVRTIQPGIESLSTPILRLMRKGSNAIQNVRLLKWCAELGIGVIWNLLYGFPGETSEHYEEMAKSIPSLVHLSPPQLSEMMVYRFSPYFERAEDFGLRVERPLPYYGLLYDLPKKRLADLAQAFEHSYVDGRSAGTYLGDVPAEVARWRDEFRANEGALRYRRGPGFLTLTDSRTTTTQGRGTLRYELDAEYAQVYLACDAGATAPSIATNLGTSEERVLAILTEFVEERLMLRDGPRYLSLALPNR